MPARRDLTRNTHSAQEDESVRSHRAPQPDEASADTSSKADEHLGATEEQVSETPAPAGDAFEDEPKQG